MHLQTAMQCVAAFCAAEVNASGSAPRTAAWHLLRRDGDPRDRSIMTRVVRFLAWCVSADARVQARGTFVLPDDSIVVNLDHTNLHLLLGRPGAAAPAPAPQMRTRELAWFSRDVEAAGAAVDEEEPPTDDEVLRALYRVLHEVTQQESFLLE